MEYYFSRHAIRRAKLYNLELDDIIEILKGYINDIIDDEYQFELIDSRFIKNIVIL